MKAKIMFLTLSLITASAFAAEPLKADREAVNAACTSEAQTAGCGTEVVGRGLLKCLHAYKKSHKEFTFSDSCKNSLEKLREDRKELKAEKK